jgi:hypothetical protein
MQGRRIAASEVEEVLRHGEVIEDYPDDFPLPSSLIRCFVGGRPLHAVIAFADASARAIAITVYEPDPTEWSEDFRHRVNPHE